MCNSATSARRATRAALAGSLVLATTAPAATIDSPHLDETALVEGCGSCHRGHGQPGSSLLPVSGEEACLQCHGGLDRGVERLLSSGARGALRDLRHEFLKPFKHSLNPGLHLGGEQLPELDPAKRRHVTCLDCHDAHRTRPLPPRRAGATSPRPSSKRGHAYEYQLCYQCHGDSANLPAGGRNIRLLSNQANPSFHPIEAPGRSGSVPSLKSPYTPQSVIACTDCHAGDGGGRGSAPHGSTHAGMLRESYATRDGQLESELSYRLCYDCHARSSIMSNASFSLHRQHLVDPPKRTSCFTCHNSHGSRRHLHLIEFNPMVVSPSTGGMLRYESTGDRQGSCVLTCHGAEHSAAHYCPVGASCPPSVVRHVGKARAPQQLTPALEDGRRRSIFDEQLPSFPGGREP